MGTFKIKRRRDGQFYWSLVAPNGEILCHSEGYTTKQSAQHGVDACKHYAYGARIADESYALA